MADRMLALDTLNAHCNPDYVPDWEAQLRWEAEYLMNLNERRDRNYEAWRRHRKGK